MYKYAMGNAALSTFIIDLKLTPEGRVQVLEFGKAWAASGLDFIPSRELLKEDITPDYKRYFNLPIVQLGFDTDHYFPHSGDVCANDMEYKGEPDHIKDRIAEVIQKSSKGHTNPEKIEDHNMLVITNIPFSHKFHAEIMEEFGPAIMLGANGPMLACMQDKAVLYHLLGQYAPDIFPKQMLIPVANGEISADSYKTIMAELSNGVVLKAPIGRNGKAVRIAGPGEITQTPDIIASLPGIEKDFLVVAQNLVRGRLIDGPPKKIAGAYDPTIRVIVSVAHENGKTRLICHDPAFNKFPRKPVGEDITEEGLISKHGSTPVTDDEKAIIFEQLQTHLPPALHRLFTGQPGSVIHDLLHSDDETDQLMGIRLMANPSYSEQGAISVQSEKDRLREIFTYSNDARRIITGQRAGWVRQNPQYAELHAAIC